MRKRLEEVYSDTDTTGLCMGLRERLILTVWVWACE
jgi:hypothetical protein